MQNMCLHLTSSHKLLQSSVRLPKPLSLEFQDFSEMLQKSDLGEKKKGANVDMLLNYHASEIFQVPHVAVDGQGSVCLPEPN